MFEKVTKTAQQIEAFVIENKAQLEQFRVLYTGRKGQIADLFDEMKTIAPEQRKAYGQELNNLKPATE
jgi:phenylalanyl-tRNA synthetase alpha chain